MIGLATVQEPGGVHRARTDARPVSTDCVFDVQTHEHKPDDGGADVDCDENPPIHPPNGLEADGRGQRKERQRADAELSLGLVRDDGAAEFVQHRGQVRVGGRQCGTAEPAVEADEALEAAAHQPCPRAVLRYRQKDEAPVRRRQVAPRENARKTGAGKFLEGQWKGQDKGKE